MKWTSLNDLREKFLSFFESKEHIRLPSFSLQRFSAKKQPGGHGLYHRSHKTRKALNCNSLRPFYFFASGHNNRKYYDLFQFIWASIGRQNKGVGQHRLSRRRQLPNVFHSLKVVIRLLQEFFQTEKFYALVSNTKEIVVPLFSSLSTVILPW